MDQQGVVKSKHAVRRAQACRLIPELAVCLVLIIIMGVFFNKFMTLAPEREFFLDDHSIGYTYIADEKVPSWLLVIFCAVMLLAGPLVEWIKGSFKRGILVACGYLYAATPMFFILEFLKIVVARLRPDFISRCDPDPNTLECRNPDELVVLKGRTSFPSGHCTFVFFAATCLSIYLCQQLRPFNGIWHGKAFRGQEYLELRVLGIVAPFIVAFYVAAERNTDHRHHKEDIVVGGLLGAGSAVLGLFFTLDLFKKFEVGKLSRYSRSRSIFGSNGPKIVDPEDNYIMSKEEMSNVPAPSKSSSSSLPPGALLEDVEESQTVNKV